MSPAPCTCPCCPRAFLLTPVGGLKQFAPASPSTMDVQAAHAHAVEGLEAVLDVSRPLKLSRGAIPLQLPNDGTQAAMTVMPYSTSRTHHPRVRSAQCKVFDASDSGNDEGVAVMQLFVTKAAALAEEEASTLPRSQSTPVARRRISSPTCENDHEGFDRMDHDAEEANIKLKLPVTKPRTKTSRKARAPHALPSISLRTRVQPRLAGRAGGTHSVCRGCRVERCLDAA